MSRQIHETNVVPYSVVVAVTVSSGVLEYESPAGGVFCSADYNRLTVRVAARPAGGKQVFVGVAPAVAVERYLGASRHARVAELDLQRWQDGTLVRRVGKGQHRIAGPAHLTFWEVKERSTPEGPARLTHSWRVPSYDEPEEVFRLVLMNVDGSRLVTSDTTIAVEVAGPTTWPFAVAILFGIAVVVAGIVVVGKRRRARTAGARRGR